MPSHLQQQLQSGQNSPFLLVDQNNWFTDLVSDQTTSQTLNNKQSVNSMNTSKVNVQYLSQKDEKQNKKFTYKNDSTHYMTGSQMNMFPIDNNNSFGVISNNSSTPDNQNISFNSNKNLIEKKNMDIYSDTFVKNNNGKNCINSKTMPLNNCSDITNLNLEIAQTQNIFCGMNGQPSYSDFIDKNHIKDKNIENDYLMYDSSIYNMNKLSNICDNLYLNKSEEETSTHLNTESYIYNDFYNNDLKNFKNIPVDENANKVADIVNKILTPQRENRVGDIIELEDQFYKLNLDNLNTGNINQNYLPHVKPLDLGNTSINEMINSNYLLNVSNTNNNDVNKSNSDSGLNSDSNVAITNHTLLQRNYHLINQNSDNNFNNRKNKYTNQTHRNIISMTQINNHLTNNNNLNNYIGNNSCYETTPNYINQKITEIKPNLNIIDKSNKLEAFRNNISSFVSLTLKDIQGWIVDFSRDQHGSRFIQQKMEKSTNGIDRDIVFKEITATDTVLYTLMTDVFGNYVVQKMLEYGNETQKNIISSHLKDRVLILTTQMYGCRVIQKAIECIPKNLQTELIHELDSHVLDCVKDQNGNHVIQKCIEHVDSDNLNFIINEFNGRVFELSSHPYGCRVIQRLMEHCDAKQTHSLMIEIFDNVPSLVKDQYGNYVIQHILDHKKHLDFPSKIINYVFDNIFVLSAHKFASNVVEKCIQFSTFAQKEQLVKFIIKNSDGGCNDNLYMMMKDPFANYVVQKIVDSVNGDLRKQLLLKMKPYFLNLKKLTYGKHMINKVDRWLKETETMTCFFKCEEEFPSLNDSDHAI